AWHVLGTVEGEGPVPDNLHLHGFVADVLVRLAPASLVVGACGDGTLAAVAGAAKRFLCLPEPRAFGEQALKAEALARLGAAVVHEGRHDGWP
ncbi:glycosyltransferase, partial [Klebsiella pneumoniae]